MDDAEESGGGDETLQQPGHGGDGQIDDASDEVILAAQGHLVRLETDDISDDVKSQLGDTEVIDREK